MQVRSQTDSNLVNLLQDRGVEQADLPEVAEQVRQLNPGLIDSDLQVQAGLSITVPDQMQVADRTISLHQVTGDSAQANIPISARQGGSGQPIGTMGQFAFQGEASVGSSGTAVLNAVRNFEDLASLAEAIIGVERFLEIHGDKFSDVEKMKFMEVGDAGRDTLERGLGAAGAFAALEEAAINAGPIRPGSWQHDPQTAFNKSTYTYDDAVVLAQYWSVSPDEAKLTIGSKLSSGDGEALEGTYKAAMNELGTASSAAANAFFKGGYHFGDAELMATHWDMGLSEAKVAIGNKILSGDTKLVDSLLADLRDVLFPQIGPAERPFGTDPAFQPRIVVLQGVDKVDFPDGEEASFHWEYGDLVVNDPTIGDPVSLDTGADLVDEQRDDFKSDAEPTEFGTPDRDLQINFAPAGGIGPYVSVARHESGYNGGAHPWALSNLATYDASTGQKVKLSDIFSGVELDQVLKAATRSMRSSEYAEGFVANRDDDDLKETFLENFAIFMDGGRPKIAVAAPHGMEANRGLMLEVIVDLPEDPELYLRLGLVND